MIFVSQRKTNAEQATHVILSTSVKMTDRPLSKWDKVLWCKELLLAGMKKKRRQKKKQNNWGDFGVRRRGPTSPGQPLCAETASAQSRKISAGQTRAAKKLNADAPHREHVAAPEGKGPFSPIPSPEKKKSVRFF